MSFDLQPIKHSRQSLEDASQSLDDQLYEMGKIEDETFPSWSVLKASSRRFVMGLGLTIKIKNLHRREKARIRRKTVRPPWFLYLWRRIPTKSALQQVLWKAGRALSIRKGKTLQ